MVAGDLLGRAPGAETPTPISATMPPALHAAPKIGGRDLETGVLLGRAPGAETPTPILGYE